MTSTYNKTIIYKIECKNNEIKDIYIGSTKNFNSRIARHKHMCFYMTDTRYYIKLYKFIHEHGDWDNWNVVKLFEYKDCTSKKEQLEKEMEYYNILKPTLNTYRPGTCATEDQIKHYYQNNIEAIHIRWKEPCVCSSCGATVRRDGKVQHAKSVKHKSHLLQRT